MRACFLGQNVCALGYGVAMVQTPPLDQASDQPLEASCGAPLPRDHSAPENPLPNLMTRELRRRLIRLS
jgi:hypothetical protein